MGEGGGAQRDDDLARVGRPGNRVGEGQPVLRVHQVEQLLGARLLEGHPALAHGLQASRVVVDADHAQAAAGERQGQRQPDPAQPDDRHLGAALLDAHPSLEVSGAVDADMVLTHRGTRERTREIDAMSRLGAAAGALKRGARRALPALAAAPRPPRLRARAGEHGEHRHLLRAPVPASRPARQPRRPQRRLRRLRLGQGARAAARVPAPVRPRDRHRAGPGGLRIRPQEPRRGRGRRSRARGGCRSARSGCHELAGPR